MLLQANDYYNKNFSSMQTASSKNPKNDVVWYTETSKDVFKDENVKHFKDLVHSYFHRYCEISTIHGVRYLYDSNISSIERLIWMALVVTSVVLTGTAYGQLAERFSAKRLVTVVEDAQYPVFYIPFPAVGICTSNRINWSRFEEAKRKFLPAGADDNMIELFGKFVARMEAMKFGNFGSFEEIEDENLEMLDFLDVTELAQFLALKCEDIFITDTCRWRGIPFDCCEYLTMEKTEAGLCLVFNSLFAVNTTISTERMANKFYPQHNSKAGQGTGLNVEMHLDDKFKRPNSTVGDGVLIMIKKPDQWTGIGYTIIPNAETFIIIRPDVTEIDQTTLNLTPAQRKCIFKEENSEIANRASVGGKYRRRNCLAVCHEEHLMQYCNCSLPLYFYSGAKSNNGGTLQKYLIKKICISDTAQQCKPSNFRCLAKNNEIFKTDIRVEEGGFYSTAQTGMICNCLIACASLDYFTSLTTLPLAAEKLSPDQNVKIFKIDVHYQSDVVVKYRTSLEFSIMDLIANFGGIFGLCMGASMVSAVELIYHLTIGFGLYLYDNNYWHIFKQDLRNLRGQLLQYWKNAVAVEHQQVEQMKNKQYPQKRSAW